MFKNLWIICILSRIRAINLPRQLEDKYFVGVIVVRLLLFGFSVVGLVEFNCYRRICSIVRVNCLPCFGDKVDFVPPGSFIFLEYLTLALYLRCFRMWTLKEHGFFWIRRLWRNFASIQKVKLGHLPLVVMMLFTYGKEVTWMLVYKTFLYLSLIIIIIILKCIFILTEFYFQIRIFQVD